MDKDYIQEEEISLLEIIQAIRKGMVFIICLVIMGAVAAITLTLRFEKVEYEAKSTVLIGKEEAKLFYEDRYTQSDITMYEKIANTYIEIAKSDRVVERVVEHYMTYTEQQIRQMVTPHYKSGTLIIELVGKGNDRNDVMAVTNTYTEIFMEECLAILPVGELMLMDEATFPEGRIPSKIILNTLIGGLLGGVISVLFVLVKEMMKGNRIRNAKEVTQYLQIPVVTMIE